jgi:hypothetical protein
MGAASRHPTPPTHSEAAKSCGTHKEASFYVPPAGPPLVATPPTHPGMPLASLMCMLQRTYRCAVEEISAQCRCVSNNRQMREGCDKGCVVMSIHRQSGEFSSFGQVQFMGCAPNKCVKSLTDFRALVAIDKAHQAADSANPESQGHPGSTKKAQAGAPRHNRRTRRRMDAHGGPSCSGRADKSTPASSLRHPHPPPAAASRARYPLHMQHTLRQSGPCGSWSGRGWSSFAGA